MHVLAPLILKSFTGEQPRITPNLLPANSAQVAVDVRLDDGALTPMNRPVHVYSFPGGSGDTFRTIFRHKGEWLGWNTVVNAVPGPVADDRLYYTGDGSPKMRVGGVVYPLAVPFPTSPLSAVLSGTPTDDLIVATTRIYVYTWVTQLGEESEPSPASNEVDWVPGQIVTLSGFMSTPPGRAITKQRIYRTQTGTAGTDLYFIAERTATTSDFIDDIPVEQFAEVIPSRAFNAPPDGLTGIISMPNGMMVAFVGKDIYFCEPWIPHAWPEAYILTVDYEVVALGAIGTSLIIMTRGHPYLASGSSPSAMTMVNACRTGITGHQQGSLIAIELINEQPKHMLGFGFSSPVYLGLRFKRWCLCRN